MARKSLGFIPLIWECAFCSTQNPGPIKSCTSCGAPQPDDVAFLQVDEEQFNFIKDESLIREAKAGPDIHCPYCGTRNPSTAELCSNCGGDLSHGGKARQAGQRVATVTEAKARPPAAAPEPRKKPSRQVTIIAIVGVVAILACLITVFMLFLNTDDVNASVTGVSWERSVAIEAYTMVTKNDWWDDIPGGADVKGCSSQYRFTSSDPKPNSKEVCSEAVVEDTGTGVGEVVQECVYEVYDDYCEYTAMDWVLVDSVTETGNNLNPVWPSPSLAADKRQGELKEDYTITFSGDGETYTYTTTDSDLFLRAAPGSRWILKVNQVGGVQSIEPNN